MRKFLMLGLGLALAGCYTVDQARFSSFVTQTVAPGMALEEALVRMRTEGFTCEGQEQAVVCTRSQMRMLPDACLERVDLVRGPGNSVRRVDVLPIKCKHV